MAGGSIFELKLMISIAADSTFKRIPAVLYLKAAGNVSIQMASVGEQSQSTLNRIGNIA